jgi:hypothetical protein
MPLDASQIRQKAQNFIDAIDRLTARQRDQMPYPQYASEYNALLEQSKEAAPQVPPEMWPPSIEMKDADVGLTQVFARYVEIETYVRQIQGNFPRPVGVAVGRRR